MGNILKNTFVFNLQFSTICMLQNPEISIPAGLTLCLVTYGNTSDGCAYIYQESDHRCCYESQDVKNWLCHSDMQEEFCRKRSEFKVEQFADKCTLYVPELRLRDSGKYIAYLPNEKESDETSVIVLEKTNIYSSKLILSVAGLISFLIIICVLWMWNRKNQEKITHKIKENWVQG